MIDLVYPIGHGSLWNNNELRYSLRSVEQHLVGFRNVVIVGERPDWLTNVIHIPCPDLGRTRPEHIYRKILKACQSSEVSDDFLFMNDDFFYLQDRQADKIPWYSDGTLDSVIEKERPTKAYTRMLIHTRNWLENRGLPTIHYDIHVPCIYKKQEFIRVFQDVDWSQGPGYVIKSMYANRVGVQPAFYEDCKINGPQEYIAAIEYLVRDRFVFSIGDNVINEVFESFCNNYFPNKSNFEL